MLKGVGDVPISDRLVVARSTKRTLFQEAVCIVALTLLMSLLWCKVYHVTSSASLNVPIAYEYDGLFNLAMIKAYRDGEVNPWAFQTVRSLDAPFQANWNDYPYIEKLLPYCVGIAARFVGLIPAFNFASLTAIILAAVSFYVTSRILNYQWMFSFVGAVMFGFSHYMFARSLYHLSLSYYWHIPLFLVVSWWCLDAKALPIKSSRWWFAAAVGALTGLQVIYYSFIFWQFLGFAMAMHFLRRNTSKLISILSIAATSVGFTCLSAVPFALYRILHGSNPSAVTRGFNNLQVYGMQLPELFLPPSHRWKAFFHFAQTHYFQVTAISGELGFSYIGILGIVGFLWLMGFSVVRLLQGRPQAIPVMFWQSVWILVFSLIGGVNLLLGVSGMQLFRATNRFSIVLLCLALFFLVRQLGRMCPRQLRPVLACCLLLFGLWDVLPAFRGNAEIQSRQQIVSSDRGFVQYLERTVPAGTMVFQLPVMDFPEVPPHLGILDYTYFRPYLHSRTLRFSYGSDKGRPLEAWQHDVDNDPPLQMAYRLEQYGFGAIVIDRKGYADAGGSIVTALESSGRRVIERDAMGEFIAIALRPKTKRTPPEIPPFPGQGFYTWEGDWRNGGHVWSGGNATLLLTNDSGRTVEKQYTFVLGSLSRRSVTVATPNSEKAVELDGASNKNIGPFVLRLPPGETQIKFTTDAPAEQAGGVDARPLAFSVALPPQLAQEPNPILGPGFYNWEGDWQKGAHSWSRGSAVLNLDNSMSKTVRRQYSFILNSTTKRQVTVTTPGESRSVELAPNNPTTVGPFNLQLDPGRTLIRFATNRPSVVASAGDSRQITFSVAILPGSDLSAE